MMMTEEEKKRTILQNRAMHKWFTMFANELCDKNITVSDVLFADSQLDDPQIADTPARKHFDAWVYKHGIQAINVSRTAFKLGIDYYKSRYVKRFEIPWTAEFFKEIVFKGLARKVLNKNSTTELSTVQLSEIAKAINDFYSLHYEIYVEFPSLDKPLLESYDEKNTVGRLDYNHS